MSPRPRRSQTRLEEVLALATSRADKATAHFELGLFHDNNGREAEAIPHYEAALANGLAGERRDECLAWLASSLYKTGRLDEALECLKQAREVSDSPDLIRFLFRLEQRVRVAIAQR